MSRGEDPKPRHTPDSVKEIIAKNIEPETAEEVLAALKALDGQLITTRVLDRLPGGRVEWRIHRQLGGVEIRNRAYTRGQVHGVCLTLTKIGDVIHSKVIERENPEYFKRRRARNEARAQALQNTHLLQRLAVLFNEVEELQGKARFAKKQLAVFVGEFPDLEEAIGLEGSYARSTHIGEKPMDIDVLMVGPVPGVKVLGRNGTFRNARLTRNENRIELWLGTEKERFPLVTFPVHPKDNDAEDQK
jgi:hypothetical protein